MQAVNLLPRDAYAPKQRLPHAPIVLAATAPVLASALVYLGYSLEHSKVNDRRIELSVVQSQVEALRPSANLAAAASAVASERAARELELSDALGGQVSWDVTLDQIARVLPTNAWLTSLSAQVPTAAAAATTAASTSVSIVGQTYTVADVAHVLARLALVPNLTNVSLASATSTEAPNQTQKLVTFTINASLGSGS